LANFGHVTGTKQEPREYDGANKHVNSVKKARKVQKKVAKADGAGYIEGFDRKTSTRLLALADALVNSMQRVWISTQKVSIIRDANIMRASGILKIMLFVIIADASSSAFLKKMNGLVRMGEWHSVS
jgi:hypothetical protein